MSSASIGSNATLFENAFYVGINLQNILYGIQLVLYFKTMRVLTCRREPRRSDMFYAVFSSMMLLLITIRVSAAAVLGQEIWLLDRDYPGGPFACGKAHASDIYMSFATTATIVLQQMTDGLMLYRCRNVWVSTRAIILPSILWLTTIMSIILPFVLALFSPHAELALGMLILWTSSTPASGPGTVFFSGISAKLGLAYYSASIFLNAALACMICYRLVCHARTVEGHLGEEHAPPYSGIIMLLVESVLPYTLSGVAFLVSYGVGSQTAITFSCVYTLMMCVSPQVLILRVAEARAWPKASVDSSASAMVFSPGHGDASPSFRFSDTGAVVMHLETSPSAFPTRPKSCEDPDKV